MTSLTLGNNGAACGVTPYWMTQRCARLRRIASFAVFWLGMTHEPVMPVALSREAATQLAHVHMPQSCDLWLVHVHHSFEEGPASWPSKSFRSHVMSV
jgi:hypothetical protein